MTSILQSTNMKSICGKLLLPLGLFAICSSPVMANYNNDWNSLHNVRKAVPAIRKANVTISGTITDEQKQPLPGVSVFEKQSKKGTVTDGNGKFTISIADGSTLVFSYLGYITQELSVSGNRTLNITLKEESNTLDEVSIGYQKIRKSDVTGAISSVKASELNLTSPTVGQALVGKVAGVQVSQTSGAPYAGTKIRVRGVGSINASSDPLYVIDGYPSGNNVSINPEDIESIDILKDAASAAIYGSRASGGVVLITTKRGKEGKGKFQYDVQSGFSQLAKKVNLLDADQYISLLIDGRNNAYKDLVVNGDKMPWSDNMFSDDNDTRIKNVGNGSSVSIPTDVYDFSTQTPIPAKYNTDWQDELYRNAFFQRHNLSFTGGNNDIKYFLSGGYQDNDGIVSNTNQKVINFRANIDGKISDRLRVGANISHTQNDNREVREGRYNLSPMMSALIYLPNLPARDANGTPIQYGMGALASQFGIQNPENPLATVEQMKITRNGYRSSYNANATYNILEGLAFKANVGMQTYNEKYDYYLPTSLSAGNLRHIQLTHIKMLWQRPKHLKKLIS